MIAEPGEARFLNVLTVDEFDGEGSWQCGQGRVIGAHHEAFPAGSTGTPT